MLKQLYNISSLKYEKDRRKLYTYGSERYTFMLYTLLLGRSNKELHNTKKNTDNAPN
jgi:hypothetical protein